MINIPSEIIRHTASFLEGEEIVRFREVCKKFNVDLNTSMESIWKQKCEDRWEKDLRPVENSWFKCFKLHAKWERGNCSAHHFKIVGPQEESQFQIFKEEERLHWPYTQLKTRGALISGNSEFVVVGKNLDIEINEKSTPFGTTLRIPNAHPVTQTGQASLRALACNREQIVSVTNDSELRIWDIRTGERQGTFQLPTILIKSLKWAEDKIIACGESSVNEKSNIFVVDIKNNNCKELMWGERHAHLIEKYQSIVTNPKWIACLIADNCFAVWDLQDPCAINAVMRSVDLPSVQSQPIAEILLHDDLIIVRYPFKIEDKRLDILKAWNIKTKQPAFQKVCAFDISKMLTNETQLITWSPKHVAFYDFSDHPSIPNINTLVSVAPPAYDPALFENATSVVQAPSRQFSLTSIVQKAYTSLINLKNRISLIGS